MPDNIPVTPNGVPEPEQWLNLVATKCPLNFVQTCLALEKMATGQVLGVIIAADGPSALNIPNSIAQEGHTVLAQQPLNNDTDSGTVQRLALWIKKEGA